MSANPFMVVVETSVNKSKALDEIRKALKELDSHDVYVGVPKESNEAHLVDGKAPVTPINNAHLMYIHTYGSPIRKIPSREILETAITYHKEQFVRLIREATLIALDGKIAGVKPALEKIGIHGANVSKDWFTNPANNWPDIQEKTKLQKKSDRPLIDTQQLRKSITHVVDKKGARS